MLLTSNPAHFNHERKSGGGGGGVVHSPFGRYWQTGNSVPLPEFERRTIQPAASRYTVYSIPTPIRKSVLNEKARYEIRAINLFA
jgi:hypothetical protein